MLDRLRKVFRASKSTPPAADPFVIGWHRFLQEVELSRNYPLPYQLSLFGVAARNPILERILPSLLYIKMTSLIDDGLQAYMLAHGLTAPKSFPDSFGGRINFLAENGALAHSDRLRTIKDRRNELAHQADKHATWEELDQVLNPTHQELHHLGLVGTRPKYEAFAECSALRETKRPDALFECTRTFGLKRDGKIVVSIGSTEYTLKD